MGCYSSPLQTLISRLNAHKATGKMLAGYVIEDAPTREIEGAKDLPNVRIFVPDFNLQLYQRADETGTIAQKIAVSTLRDDGMVEHIEAVELVLDAIETDANGQYEPSLDRSIARPFDVSSSEPFITDLSITTQLTINIKMRPVARGRRHES